MKKQLNWQDENSSQFFYCLSGSSPASKESSPFRLTDFVYYV
jgi:hypothetical protein